MRRSHPTHLPAFLIVLGLALSACSADRAGERAPTDGAAQPADAAADSALDSGMRGAPVDAGSAQAPSDAAPSVGPDARAASDASASTDAGSRPRLPPENAELDYQLGGAYPPPAPVAIVSRDRLEKPTPGLYNICYVNGFQSQPNEQDVWLNDHPELVLRDAQGEPVIDPDWDEMLLDIRTESSRAALGTIVGGWIERCARDGFDAVEIDNLDTYARSGGRLTQDQAVLFMRALADVAHAHGLAIAQKNAAELLARRRELGTDFAVVEECNHYDECGDFVRAYQNAVLVIEYERPDFDQGCRDFPGLSIVYRDLALSTPGNARYVYDGC
jgi:hypothetical protein